MESYVGKNKWFWRRPRKSTWAPFASWKNKIEKDVGNSLNVEILQVCVEKKDLQPADFLSRAGMSQTATMTEMPLGFQIRVGKQ